MAIDTNEIREYYETVRNYLDTLIIGEGKAKDIITSSLLCDKNSRILLIGKPGTAKSTISKGIASNFLSKKISITSDLLPIDILNSIKNHRNLRALQLEELNRASGKVQSSLIELLADNMISLEDETIDFSNFYAIATQNDSEVSGIFDVPLAIYDRFDAVIRLGNLTYDEVEQVLFDYKPKQRKADFDLEGIIDKTSSAVEEFPFDSENRRMIMEAVKIIDSTKYGNENLFATSNIRGHQFLIKMASLHALVNGKKDIMADDMSDYIEYIYAHRINQALLKINNQETKNAMRTIEGEVLSIKRNKK